MVFSVCRFCSTRTSNIKKIIVGSLVRISQTCSKCKRKWEWDSQPFISNVPSGNLLISASILFSGLFPAKALRMLKIMNCYSISTKTFFRHQRRFLQPAITSTWKQHQQLFFESIKKQKRKLALSGDGRADSPGHSAKYGSYSVIDMSCSKVVDFKLVQVIDIYAQYVMTTLIFSISTGRVMRLVGAITWRKRASSES